MTFHSRRSRMNTNFCCACGEWKPVDAFYRQPGKPDSRRSICKVCLKHHRKANYHDPAKIIICRNCGRVVPVRRSTVRYCGHRECQAERKREWEEKRLQNRPAHRENLRRCRAKEILGYSSKYCDGYIHNENYQICEACQKVRDQAFSNPWEGVYILHYQEISDEF